MCGVIGSINMLDSERFENGLNQISHRGPDAQNTYLNRNDSVFLGHSRLSIIDLSDAANQPFYSKGGRYVMVYNGELYNFKELANNYALSLNTHSDTEVIIELYAKLGSAFLNELNGMFAGAIYDTGSKELFLFRDRLGIKPLYYWKDENR